MPHATSSRARLFVAVELPAELRARLEARALDLHALEPELRAIRADAIHLTLQFLGPVDRDRAEELRRALAEVALRSSPFQAELVGLGAFPRPETAQVVWVGAHPRRELERLASGVAEALAALGFQREERPFHPHVTVGRLKTRGRHRALAEALHRAHGEGLGSFRAEALTLFESYLEPAGARYEVVARTTLGSLAGVTFA